MTATYTSSLGLALPADADTGWGTTVNNGVTSLVDSAIAGYIDVPIVTSNAITLTATNGAADTPRNMMLNITGTLTATGTVTIPARSKLYFIKNSTTGGFAITVTAALGTTVSIPNGRSMVVMCDGSNVREAVDYFNSLNTSAIGATTPGTGSFTSLAYSTTLTGGTGVINFGSGQFYKDASGNVGINTTSPGSALDVKGTLRLSGSTSGYVGFIPAAAAGATTYTLPSADGTSGQVLQTNGSSVLSWATPATGISNFTSNLNTTAPNATVPYVQLLATNAATNVDVAITPKGTGAFSLQVADNTIAGGNKRGTNAVDLQTTRNNASQVASGTNSFVVGGASTASGNTSVAFSGGLASGDGSLAFSGTASGLYSATVSYISIVSSDYSIALGGRFGNSRSLVGNKVFPAGFGSTSGARQLTFVILGLDTTDATTSYLGSDGTSSINSTTTNIVLPNNSAFYFKGTVVAGVTGGGNTKGWTIEGMVKRGAAVAFVGTPTVTSSFADAGASSWTLAVATNATIGGINIVATGQASTNIRWVGNFEIVEMTY